MKKLIFFVLSLLVLLYLGFETTLFSNTWTWFKNLPLWINVPVFAVIIGVTVWIIAKRIRHHEPIQLFPVEDEQNEKEPEPVPAPIDNTIGIDTHPAHSPAATQSPASAVPPDTTDQSQEPQPTPAPQPASQAAAGAGAGNGGLPPRRPRGPRPPDEPPPHNARWWAKFFEFLFVMGIVTLLSYIWSTNGWVWGVVCTILILASIATVCYLLWQLAHRDILFTFVELGTIKVFERGEGNPVKVLANLPNNHVHNMEIVEGKPHKTMLQKHFGMYWKGVFTEVHELKFVHERKNPDIDKDTPSSDWIQRDNEAKESDYLLWEIPHSYAFFGVEFGNQFKADILFESRSRVLRPLTIYYVRQGKFIDYMAEYVEAAVNEALRQINFSEFVKTEKTDGCELSTKILGYVNPHLPEAVGTNMVGGFISRYDASDKTEEQALQEKERARLAGEAQIEKARLAAEEEIHKAEQVRNRAKGERDAEQIRAEAQVSELQAGVKVLKEQFPDVDPALILNRAADLASVIKLTNPSSRLTAIGTGINIGVGQQTSQKKEKE